MRILFGLFCLSMVHYFVSTQDCSTGIETGNPNQGPDDWIDINRNSNSDLTVNRVYLFTTTGGVNCYGTITEWKFFKSEVCKKVDLTFYVFREEGPVYRLIGKNSYEHRPNGLLRNCQKEEISVKIGAMDQIPVIPGDFIGWSADDFHTITPGNEDSSLIMYTTANGPSQIKQSNAGTDASCDGVVGNTGCTFSNFPVLVDFSLKAVLGLGVPPSIDNLPHTAYIDDNKPGLTYVHDIIASHVYNRASYDMDMVPITFSIEPPVPEFQINEAPYTLGDIVTTGQLLLSGNPALDFDRQSQYTLNIVIDGFNMQDTGTVIVNINKIHNPVEIDASNLDETISAQTKNKDDEVLKVETVEDRPDRQQVNVTFFIVSSTPIDPPAPFYIDTKSGSVKCTEDLDKWVGASPYYLEIMAFDGVNTDIETFKITITDMRAAPEILNLPGTVAINEDLSGIQRGEVIYPVQVKSDWPDTLEFDITNVDNLPSQFTIDTSTGHVYLVQDPEFNYHIHQSYALTISVKDNVQAGVSKILTVNINRINREPIFTPTFYYRRMEEECRDLVGGPCRNCPGANCALNLPVLTVTTYDRDRENSIGTDQPDALTCEILPSPGALKFAFDQTPAIPQAILEITERINIDTDPATDQQDCTQTMNLTIKVKDNGTPEKATVGNVLLEIIDVNDEPPVFVDTPSSHTIDENTLGGTSLFIVSTKDADCSPEFGQVWYSLNNEIGYPDGTYHFMIETKTGIFKTKYPIDYEQRGGIYKVIVVADDGANRIPKTITINVNDVNDNHPEFQCNINRVENEPKDPSYPNACFYNLELRGDTFNRTTPVLTLKATDKDTITQDLSYYFLKPEPQFTIGSNTGKIEINPNLRLKYDHKYGLYSMVSDQGTPELLSTPPTVVRIDTYTPSKYLIDIHLDIQDWTPENETEFENRLREFVKPNDWFVKVESQSFEGSEAKMVVTIYAFLGNSTFFYKNMNTRKIFIHRDQLLPPLRKDFWGTPTDDLINAFPDFKPKLVAPTIPNWWLDTLEGLITLSVLCLLGGLLLLGLAIGLCKYNRVCCFKPTRKTKHAWQDPKQPPQHQPEPDPSPPSTSHEPVRQRNRRRPSVDTIHSLIWDPKRNDIFLD